MTVHGTKPWQRNSQFIKKAQQEEDKKEFVLSWLRELSSSMWDMSSGGLRPPSGSILRSN
jgi:hypothetical protein